MRIGRRLATLTALALGLVVVTGPAAQAAYYNTYTDIASTPDVDGDTAAQGFAAGETYLYSAKIRSSNNDDRAVIYRVNRKTGEKSVMKNGTDGGVHNTWLSHANDMTIADIDGKHHLFVVTMTDSGAQLVKLRYDGATYYKEGSYSVHLDGKTKAMSGVQKVSTSSSAISFMFKSGTTYYKGSLPLRDNSGTIDVTKTFSAKTDGAIVNGEPVDLDGFVNQGFYYDPTKKLLYHPVTKGNVSIVLVYRDVSPSSTGTLTSADDLSFRVTSKKYPKSFEIEGVGVSNGTLYFSTNRSNADGAFDGVHAFKGYTA